MEFEYFPPQGQLGSGKTQVGLSLVKEFPLRVSLFEGEEKAVSVCLKLLVSLPTDRSLRGLFSHFTLKSGSATEGKSQVTVGST